MFRINHFSIFFCLLFMYFVAGDSYGLQLCLGFFFRRLSLCLQSSLYLFVCLSESLSLVGLCGSRCCFFCHVHLCTLVSRCLLCVFYSVLPCMCVSSRLAFLCRSMCSNLCVRSLLYSYLSIWLTNGCLWFSSAG